MGDEISNLPVGRARSTENMCQSQDASRCNQCLHETLCNVIFEHGNMSTLLKNALHMVCGTYFNIMETTLTLAKCIAQFWIGNPHSLPWRWRVFRLCLDTLVANRQRSDHPLICRSFWRTQRAWGMHNGIFPTCSNKTNI